MKHFIIICLLYWVILSERFTAEGIIIGILIVTAVLYFNRDSIVNYEYKKLINYKNLRLWGIYIAVLLKEIVVANFHVAKIVLSRELKISPMIVKVNTGIKSDLNKVILANSITLTPGTLTIRQHMDELIIHCLDEKSAEGVQNSKFEKIIMEVEG